MKFSTWAALNMANKILFISGTLETGKSGVADYILVLCKELTKLGLACKCIAIHDVFLAKNTSESIVRYNIGKIQLVRFSSLLTWSARAHKLRAEIKDFGPDWISLQYVPYAFHPKGLPFVLIKCLNSVQPLASWEIMVHEIWVDPEVGIKSRILSSIQQYILLTLLKRLRPTVIHTTNFWYQKLLDKSGFNSQILPLFSSIPFEPLSLSVSNLDLNRSGPRLRWSFVVFGTINRNWDPYPLLERIESTRIYCNIDFCNFVAVGNIGEYGNELWDSLKISKFVNFDFLRLGELTVEEVSEQLQLADFGISVAPSHLIDKSSSVAAMISHGLPVIITRLSPHCEQWHRSLKNTCKYILLDSSFAETLANTERFQPKNTISTTAKQFIHSLGFSS